MKTALHRHTISFKHAFNGVSWAITNNPNYLIHVALSLIALGAGAYFQILYFEWLVLVLTIGIGFVIESLNSALEAMGDAITKDYREEIKIAKDVSAGAMFLYAVMALSIALFIFGPRVYDLFLYRIFIYGYTGHFF